VYVCLFKSPSRIILLYYYYLTGRTIPRRRSTPSTPSHGRPLIIIIIIIIIENDIIYVYIVVCHTTPISNMYNIRRMTRMYRPEFYYTTPRVYRIVYTHHAHILVATCALRVLASIMFLPRHIPR
jgi:hypothetical protein